MSTPYKKHYRNNHVVAFGRGTGPIDHPFIRVPNEAQRDTLASFNALIHVWNHAVGLEERSIFFNQRFDRNTADEALFQFAGVASPQECWPRNIWPMRLTFDAKGASLLKALKDFFDGILKGADPSSALLEVGHITDLQERQDRYRHAIFDRTKRHLKRR